MEGGRFEFSVSRIRRWKEVSTTHTSTAGQAMRNAEVDAATVKPK
jgi:hypothetical protein